MNAKDFLLIKQKKINKPLTFFYKIIYNNDSIKKVLRFFKMLKTILADRLKLIKHILCLIFFYAPLSAFFIPKKSVI